MLFPHHVNCLSVHAPVTKKSNSSIFTPQIMFHLAYSIQAYTPMYFFNFSSFILQIQFYLVSGILACTLLPHFFLNFSNFIHQTLFYLVCSIQACKPLSHSFLDISSFTPQKLFYLIHCIQTCTPLSQKINNFNNLHLNYRFI